MNVSEILEQIRRLPESERSEVAAQIAEEFKNVDDGLTPEVIEEMERRAERLSRNPEIGISWERVRAELPKRLKERKCAGE